jgi:hypothetical protein
MKSAKFLILIAALLLMSSCTTTPIGRAVVEEVDIGATVEHKLSVAKTETAEFQAALAIEMTNQAPTLTFTPDVTITPAYTNTPTYTETPAPEPTSDNPWMMQAYCETSNKCMKVRVENKTSDWAQITLTDSEGFAKFFTVAPHKQAYITLMKGSYRYIYNFCDGKQYFKGFHNLSSSWYILAKCSY